MKPTLTVTTVTSEIRAYVIKFSNGLYFRVLNYGIAITDWGMNKQESWILKHSNDEAYLENKDYLGCIIGPYAGRIKNASFILNETLVTLDKNDGNHCLHSGNLGLSRVCWDVNYTIYDDKVILTFTYEVKKDNRLINYPGQGLYKVILTVNDTKEISLEYETDLDEETYISLTHHIYFKTKNLQDHLYINSTGYHELDEDKIPTGLHIKSPKLSEMTLKAWFKVVNEDKGLDHPFILQKKNSKYKEEIDLSYTTPSYQLKLSTSCSHMVVYSGGYLKNPFSGIAFEPQEIPDGPNQGGDDVIPLKKIHKCKTSYGITEL